MRAGRKNESSHPGALFDYVRDLAERTGADGQRLFAGFGVVQLPPQGAFAFQNLFQIEAHSA